MTTIPLAADQERTWCSLAHLSSLAGYFTGIGFWLGPLIVMLVYQDRSAAVAREARESLNFQISLLIYYAIAGLLCFVLIGIPLLAVLALAQLVLPIYAGIRTSEGVAFEYPLTLRILS